MRGPRGAREPAEVIEGILALKPDLSACAADGHVKEPERHGKVVIDFTINPDGTVSNIEAVSRTTAQTVFAQCLVKIVMPRLRFKPSPQPAEARFPFKF